MKQNSSTMTSARQDIDAGKSYVFMSSELEGKLLEGQATQAVDNQVSVLVNLGGDYTLIPLLSASIDKDGRRVLCIDSKVLVERLLNSLIVSEDLDLSLMGHEFKAHVISVDYDRSYLRILEQ